MAAARTCLIPQAWGCPRVLEPPIYSVGHDSTSKGLIMFEMLATHPQALAAVAALSLLVGVVPVGALVLAGRGRTALMCVTVALLGMAWSVSVDAWGKSRTIEAIEAKYESRFGALDVAGELGSASSTWVFDGVAVTCDATRAAQGVEDPTLMCK